jgi:hypothetical protein
MKIHINAIFHAIDGLFSESVEVTNESLIAKFIESEPSIKPPFYQYQPIDTYNSEALRALAERMLNSYLKQHADNSLQLFIINEVKRARQNQRNFPEFETDSKQKTYYFRLERWIAELEKMLPQQVEVEQEKILPQQAKAKQETPKTFEELFYNPEHAEPCLRILSELQPPLIDAINNYIGKAKGVFPLWVKVLKKHAPHPLIKHFKDNVYKDLLNQKIKGLNLSKDASEFRKQYKMIENNKIELDIKTLLSQFSQSGKLGK